MKNKMGYWGGPLALAVLFTAITLTAEAGTVYSQDFEDPLWTPGSISGDWNNYDATITRVATGTNGIASSGGIGHAIISGNGATAPYTTLGGYSSDFGGGFTVSLDVYLDPTWSEGTGFEFSTAVSTQTGSHLRDFIWHVGVVGTDLLVNASNNTDFSINSSTLLSDNGGDFATIATAGWYTFETDFYDNGGALAVDFNLYDSSSTLVHSITRSDAGDLIATVVGGNRYGWLTYNNVDDLAIDNTCLTTAVVPLPGAAGLGLLGMALVGVRRRFRKNAA